MNSHRKHNKAELFTSNEKTKNEDAAQDERNKTEQKIQTCIQVLKEWKEFSFIDNRKLTQPGADISIPPENEENILNRRNAGKKMAVAIIKQRVFKRKNFNRVA